MNSEVNITTDCQATLQDLSNGSIRYVICKIEGKNIVVEAAVTSQDIGISNRDNSENSKTAYEYFVNDLKERTVNFSERRYGIFDFHFTSTKRGVGVLRESSLVLIQFYPFFVSSMEERFFDTSASAIKTVLGTSKFLQVQAQSEGQILHSEMHDRIVKSLPKKVDLKWWVAFCGMLSGLLPAYGGFYNKGEFGHSFSHWMGISSLVFSILLMILYYIPKWIK